MDQLDHKEALVTVSCRNSKLHSFLTCQHNATMLAFMCELVSWKSAACIHWPTFEFAPVLSEVVGADLSYGVFRQKPNIVLHDWCYCGSKWCQSFRPCIGLEGILRFMYSSVLHRAPCEQSMDFRHFMAKKDILGIDVQIGTNFEIGIYTRNIIVMGSRWYNLCSSIQKALILSMEKIGVYLKIQGLVMNRGRMFRHLKNAF